MLSALDDDPAVALDVAACAAVVAGTAEVAPAAALLVGAADELTAVGLSLAVIAAAMRALMAA